MVRATQHALAILGGAVIGYAVLVAVANLESTSFYTIRSFVTGRQSLSEIIDHPADRWVAPVLMAVFVGVGGAVAGVLLSWRSRPMDQTKPNKALQPTGGPVADSGFSHPAGN
ncbi:hypothetical protein [Zavarzinella formosa]|uniref:hypothetical protein n=1 Tax=Zavarzinella formosa TaxID=360055 RepID=UPI0002EC8B5E|nr:hypothetical protein [Zavarzinella formosa]